MENSKLPAFPVRNYKELADDIKNEFRVNNGYNPTGLTKREYLAALAMQGLMGSFGLPNKERAKMAIETADELLKQLEK